MFLAVLDHSALAELAIIVVVVVIVVVLADRISSLVRNLAGAAVLPESVIANHASVSRKEKWRKMITVFSVFSAPGASFKL